MNISLNNYLNLLQCHVTRIVLLINKMKNEIHTRSFKKSNFYIVVYHL